MQYQVISADCHIDLIWLPPDLFTVNASNGLKDRMPYVTDGEKGPVWVSRGGAQFGLQNGMGSAGREYVPGQIHRSDRMAETGLYEDGKKGIRRLTDPELRIKDQDRDGVQAEVLYGILGASQRLGDPEAATEMTRIYNEWLADFCRPYPERFAGIASIPNHDMTAGVAEIERVAKTGVARGIEPVARRIGAVERQDGVAVWRLQTVDHVGDADRHAARAERRENVDEMSRRRIRPVRPMRARVNLPVRGLAR